VYFTLLATSTTSTHRKLTNVHENITEILILHEDLLSRLREIVPHSSMNNVLNTVAANLKVPRPTRRHSVNAPPVTRSKSPRFDVRRSLDTRRQKSVQDGTLVSEPKEAAKIALIFEDMVCVNSKSYIANPDADNLCNADEPVLYLRGVWGSI